MCILVCVGVVVRVIGCLRFMVFEVIDGIVVLMGLFFECLMIWDLFVVGVRSKEF